VSKNNSGNNHRNQSMRNQEDGSDGSTLKVKIGIVYLILCSLCWSVFSHLIVIVGLWEYVGKGDTADTVITTISIFLPTVVSFVLLFDLRQD